MEALAPFVPLFVAVIAFSAFFTIFGFIIKLFLKPLEDGMKELKDEIRENRSSINNLKDSLITSK